MKTSIGIRVTPKIIYFSVVSGEVDGINIQLVDKIINPKSLKTPEQLKYIRNTLSDIIHEYSVTNACIRVTESNAQKPSIDRIHIEGVVQELFASSTIEKYFIGQIASISAKLDMNRKKFKDIASGEDNYLEITDWKENYILEERESIMSAISSLEI